MSPYVYFLFTILDESQEELVRVAVQMNLNEHEFDMENLMAPVNRSTLRGMLPPHIRKRGPIVAIESIFGYAELKP